MSAEVKARSPKDRQVQVINNETNDASAHSPLDSVATVPLALGSHHAASTTPTGRQAATRHLVADVTYQAHMHDVDKPGNISPMKAPRLAEVKAQQASSTSPMRDVDEPGDISPMKAPTIAAVKGFLCKEYTDLEAEEIRQSYVEQVAEITAKLGNISPMKAPTLAEVKGFLCSEYTDLEAEEVRESYVEQVAEMEQTGNISPLKPKILMTSPGITSSYVEQVAEVKAQGPAAQAPCVMWTSQATSAPWRPKQLLR